MAAETESGFLIDGKVYEVPSLWEFDMSERRLMFELCGYTQEDFLAEDDETPEEHEARIEKMRRHPGFAESLMIVAYQRGNPGLKPGKVKLVIDKTSYMDAIQGFQSDGETEGDEPPLALTSEPSESSPSGPLDNESSTPPTNGNGGDASTPTSGLPAGIRGHIGTTGSGTSSISGRGISAA